MAPLPEDTKQLRALYTRTHWVRVAAMQAKAWEMRLRALGNRRSLSDSERELLVADINALEDSIAADQASYDALIDEDTVSARLAMESFIAGVADGEKYHLTVQFEFLYTQ